ncbi:unnamed protein product [Toxocara canis]|uniref:PhoLip_ATPase_C domain-containing protein n=1 Tax=Toxocara canis TaxID=6265 RepID=A0A183V7Z0_TOXCA|nr:unnamed protein product [Toxocara canis]
MRGACWKGTAMCKKWNVDAVTYSQRAFMLQERDVAGATDDVLCADVGCHALARYARFNVCEFLLRNRSMPAIIWFITYLWNTGVFLASIELNATSVFCLDFILYGALVKA